MLSSKLNFNLFRKAGKKRERAECLEQLLVKQKAGEIKEKKKEQGEKTGSKCFMLMLLRLNLRTSHVLQ